MAWRTSRQLMFCFANMLIGAPASGPPFGSHDSRHTVVIRAIELLASATGEPKAQGTATPIAAKHSKTRGLASRRRCSGSAPSPERRSEV
jgi:hypothetical protein